jgi:hypothetical protein
LVGALIAYSGIIALGYSPAGRVVALVIYVIVCACIYYLVVVSRYPWEKPH